MRIYILSLVVLALIVQINGRSAREKTKEKKDGGQPWSKHQRPQYMFAESQSYAAHAHKSRAERDVNMFRTARRYIREHPEIIPSVYAMFAKIQNLQGQGMDAASSDAVFTCPEYGMYPCEVQPTMASDDDIETMTYVDLMDTWRDLVAHIADDSQECTDCVSFWTELKAVACGGMQWELMRPIVINWCMDNLPLLPEVCEGVITIQGEHVYCIVTQADPRNFCESLNNCFPDDTRLSRPPVSERTPWAVKAQLEARGEWPSARADGRRRTSEGDNYVKIAALADIHLQMEHAVGSATECLADVCCLEEFEGEGSARYWGEYTCNMPPHTLQLFMDRVHGIHPDFVIYAGDSPPHTMHKETEASQLNCSAIVADMMTKSFGPDLRVYPAIGNHEMYPTNLYSKQLEETNRQTKRFAEIWSGLAGFDETNNQSFADMSLYSMLVPGHPNLRVVCINSEFDWYVANFYATLNEHTDENTQHKTWVNETLRQARANNEKVIIISHHPVGGGDGNVRSARWWEEIAVEYGDIIVLHVSGHTHSDQVKLAFDPETMRAMTVNHVAPATSSKSYINPSLVMYYLDPTNYTLMEYESFHLEIKDQQQSIVVPPAIAFGYSAREEYGMPDLTPESYKQLLIRFTDDEALFHKYYLNQDSHSEPDLTCDYDCRVRAICNIWFSELPEANECVQVAPPAPPGTTVPTGGGAALTASMLVIMATTLMTDSFV